MWGKRKVKGNLIDGSSKQVKEKVLDKKEKNVMTVKITEKINYKPKELPIQPKKETKIEKKIETNKDAKIINKKETKKETKKQEKIREEKKVETTLNPIEEINGMKIQDIARKLKQQEKELIQKRTQINDYILDSEEMRKILYPLLEREYYLNQDVAESVVNKYGVNPVDKHYRFNIDNPKYILKAIHWIKYCHDVSESEVIEKMKQYQSQLSMLQGEKEEQDETHKKELENIQLERQKEKEEMQRVVKAFQEKYAKIQEEIAIKNDEIIQLKERVNQMIEEKPQEMPTYDEYDEMEGFEMEEEPEPESIPEELPEIKETQESNDLLDDIDLSFIEEEKTEEVEDDMPYVHLLKEKGYQLENPETTEFDWVIAKETSEDKVPLRYIYYDIEKAEEFDDMMKNTDKMYFVFDHKKRLYKGNTKFTSWLLKQKNRKYDIQFSFTTVDQLKVNGLNSLDKM